MSVKQLLPIVGLGIRGIKLGGDPPFPLLAVWPFNSTIPGRCLIELLMLYIGFCVFYLTHDYFPRRSAQAKIVLAQEDVGAFIYV